MSNHLISFMIGFPLLGMLVQAAVPALGKSSRPLSRSIALVASLASSACAFALVLGMAGQLAEPQAVESIPWIGSYAISYEVAADGLNALPILLIALVLPVLISSEWAQKSGPKGMHGLFLLLQASLFGSVCAQDLFLLFFFWSLSALPFYFLIGIWGGDDREAAAFRGVVVASIGNALVFAALVLVYYSVDPHTFSIRDLAGGKLIGKSFELGGESLSVPALAFGLVSAGLALRAPVWPFHGWFTQAAKEAPASVFVALSAVAVPVSTSIFLRLGCTLFPETLRVAAPAIVAIGTVNLVVGGICAASQKELKSLLSYLCLSEVGLVLLGVGSLSSPGVVGAVYHQLVLGLGIAGFGLFTGAVLDRVGHAVFLSPEGERNLGGIAARTPGLAVVAGVVVASLLGFPGSGGFVGHALLVIGSFAVHPLSLVVTCGALLLAAYYLFTMYRYVFLGRPSATLPTITDLTLREKAYLMPLVGALLFFGLYPRPWIDLIRPTVLTLLSTVK